MNATCKVVYRLITNDMLINSVTLRLDDITAASFMTSMYGYTVQALAEVLRLLPSQIYIIDIKVGAKYKYTCYPDGLSDN